MVDMRQYSMVLLVRIILFYYFTINYHFVVCPTVTCDFEVDECNWKLDSTWKIYPSGSTVDTASSGPVADHTTGNGSYARFMATLLPDSNQFGIMSTNTSLAQSVAFSFWYFMHGSQIGTLALLVNNNKLWEKNGRQGFPAWYQASINLLPGVQVKIEFLANRSGIGRSSDMAIDDIMLQGEPMPLSTRTTGTRPPTTPRTRSNASCDFDVDKELCGWKSDTKYGWKVIHEREPNITIGPASDYSSTVRANVDGKTCKIPYDEKGNQYYCMLNKKVMQCKGSDNKWINCRDGGFVQIRTGQFDQVGERSQFDSPVLDALSEEGCIQFQYNIDGTDNDGLNVYVEDYWTGRQSCMWHKNGSSIPNRWITAEAPLKLERDGKYQVVFEARKGIAGGIGLVSLDHIVISSRQCSGTYPVEQCPYEEVPTSTSLMTTTIDFTTMANIAMTSDNFEINTSEMDTTTNDAVITSTTYVHTDVPIVFNTTRSTSTSSSTTSTIPQITTEAEPWSTPIEITGTELKTSFETSTSVIGTFDSTIQTTKSSTFYTTTLTTTNKSDVGGLDTTTEGSPEHPSLAGIIIGTLAGVLSVILIVIIYLKRHHLRARFFPKRSMSGEINFVYSNSNSNSSDGIVRLDNVSERESLV